MESGLDAGLVWAMQACANSIAGASGDDTCPRAILHLLWSQEAASPSQRCRQGCCGLWQWDFNTSQTLLPFPEAEILPGSLPEPTSTFSVSTSSQGKVTHHHIVKRHFEFYIKSIDGLQYCISFRYTAKWLSYTCIFFFRLFSHLVITEY